MLSISEARSRWWFVIKIQSGVARGAIQRAQRLRRINADYALCASHFTQNATLSFLLFIVTICFDAQTARRQCARRCGWMGAFKCRKAVICFIHSLLPLKVALCRHLTELGAFRFGSGQFSQWTFNVLAPPARAVSAPGPRSPRWLMDSFIPNHFVLAIIEAIFRVKTFWLLHNHLPTAIPTHLISYVSWSTSCLYLKANWNMWNLLYWNQS